MFRGKSQGRLTAHIVPDKRCAFYTPGVHQGEQASRHVERCRSAGPRLAATHSRPIKRKHFESHRETRGQVPPNLQIVRIPMEENYGRPATDARDAHPASSM